MRSRGCRSFRSSSGSRSYDEPPPERLEEGDLERLRAEDRFREANRPHCLDRGGGREDRRPRVRGHGSRRLDDVQPRHHGHHDSGRRLRGPAPRSRRFETTPSASCRRSAAAPDSRRRAGWSAGRSSGSTPRRPGRRSRSRSERTAPRSTSSSERARSRGTGSTTRTGTSPRSRGRSTSRPGTARRTASDTPWGDEESEAFVTAAESALEREISRELMARQADLPSGARSSRTRRSSSRAHPATSSTSSSTACSPWRSTARRSPRSGRARSSASARCSRAAREPRRSARARAARIAVIPGELIDRQELEDLAATRRA